MKITMKNLFKSMTAAVTLMAASFAGAGDVFEIRPCDAVGTTLPSWGDGHTFSTGEAAYFYVRLVKRAEADNPFRMDHIGSSDTLDWLVRRPAIGIFVNGNFTTAQYEGDVTSADNNFTTVIFSYFVQPGELALPVRLADANKQLIADDTSAPTVGYYFNFRDPAFTGGHPAWNLDNSTVDKGAYTYEAGFTYVAGTEAWMGGGPDGDGPVVDYSLAKANIRVKSVDFDVENPIGAADWRIVHESGFVSNTVPARLIFDGVALTNAQIYLWAEKEDAFRVYGGGGIGENVTKKAEQKDIHVTADTTEKRWVLTIDTAKVRLDADGAYNFELLGVARDKTGTLVLSPFPDYNYAPSGLSSRPPLKDYLTVQVRCADPRPPTVSARFGLQTVVANAAPNVELTAVTVSVSPAWQDGHEFDLTLTPSFTDSTGARPWYDYLRFANGRNKEVTLQTAAEYAVAPVVTIGADGRATKLNGVDLEDPGVFYVYGLYGDAFSDGTKGKFTFALSTADAEAQAAVRGWGERVTSLTMKADPPEITSKSEALKATVNEARSFDLVLSDVWASMKSESGYKLYYQHTAEGESPDDESWKEVKGGATWKPDNDGLLKENVTDGKAPSLTYPLVGTKTTWFYVTGPNGKESGKDAATALKVKVTVSGKNTIRAEVSTDQSTWVASGKFKEDSEADIWVRVKLDEPLEDGQTVYAFLAPVGDAVDYVVGDAVTNSDYTSGIEIEGGRTESEIDGMFRIVDGTKAGKALKFDIVLCKTQQWDPGEIVGGCQSKTLSLTALNVEPTFKTIKMDNVSKVENAEETMHTGKDKITYVPIGVPKTFTFDVTEPSDVDRTATGDAPAGSTWEKKDFAIEWTVVEENGAYGSGTVMGNPATTNFTYTFTGSGRAEVTLKMHDKDMTGWSEEYLFYVEVTSQPSVVVTAPEAITENMTGFALAPIELTLSDHATETLTGRVTVVYNETANKDPLKRGFVHLGGVIDGTMEIDPETGDVSYLFELVRGRARLFVDECDGTDIGNRKGFTIKAKIEDERVNPVTKKTWTTCYDEGMALMYVGNDAPQLTECSLGATVAEGNTNEVQVGIGEVINVNYRVEDILPDLTNATGIAVQWWDTDNKSAPVTNICDSTNTYLFTTKFKSSGSKTIRVTLTDKDLKPTYVGEWYFTVESTKTLVTIPNGPTGKGDSTLSSRYAGARGSGEGHVWSDASFAYADSFLISWNCNPSAVSALVYGYGYKTNRVDDGTLVDPANRYFHDIPLSPIGNNTTESGKSELSAYYEYKGVLDSFLYGWISHSSQSGGGSGGQGGTSGLTSTFAGIAPEYSERAPKPATANLPTANGNNAATGAKTAVVYPTTYIEAVFSRELLPSDNMGDINWDGVPDAYLLVNDYNFGVVDPVSGEMTGDDLRDLNFTEGGEGGAAEAYGPDYLPTKDSAMYAAFIPDLADTWVDAGRPFVPRMKIRGFDEDDLLSIAKRGTSVSALNDAPAQVGVSGVKPDRIYTNPREDAGSTLNYVEWLAWIEYKATNPEATEESWSPERPTNPTKPDTDGDGMTDGYEYYFWYNAHVGYVDADGTHRYLTGRAYDPRNPGHGKLISSEEIALAFDPQSPTAYKLRDMDNDGLPDLLEFELGTNPIDFDTDGDGLPDGWEIAIAGLDPLRASSCLDAKLDTERNYDGDAMAITSYKLEQKMTPVPFNEEQIRFWTFATIDPNGDTDGVQWHAMRVDPTEYMTTVETQEEATAWSFVAEGRTYVVYGVEPQVYTNPTTKAVCLATSYAKGLGDTGAYLADASTMGVVATNSVPKIDPDTGDPVLDPDTGDPVMEDVEVTNQVMMAARGWPVRVPAGLPLDGEITKATPTVMTVSKEIKTDEVEAYAAWIYGKGAAAAEFGEVAESAAEYGCLALGRELGVPEGAVVCAVPSNDRDVALLHYMVYQEFGFDPRTAWKAKDPLATRWSKAIDGESVTGIQQMKQGGYAGKPARTRDYAAYDEFLVYSFFQNNGCDMKGVTFVPTTETYMIQTWGAFTTNPQGPGEPELVTDEHYVGRNSEEGADTDLDGVPDGWELYVMGGMKKDGRFVYANPYAGFVVSDGEKMPESYFSPFVAAAKTTDTSNQIYLGGQANDDGLNEFQEFEGTDTMAYYARTGGEGDAAGFSTTIVHAGEWKWFNKFFPTDPWNKDTDGDGLDDKQEGAAFVYGKPADDGKLWSIPGGGLNPCSVDTDQDGLPDLWEKQYAGKTPYAEANAMLDSNGNAIIDFAKDAGGNSIGNALQGLTDGMDGTVKDAYSYPITRTVSKTSVGTKAETVYRKVDGFSQVVNRDYDHDGLENWQEYLTGTMRCWRYDDPYSPWESLPEEWYGSRDPKTGLFAWAPDFSKFGLGADQEDEFWYMTLVDRESPYYNPHLIVGQNQGSQYFTRVTNAWDPAYDDASLGGRSTYYYFPDRVNGEKIETAWVAEGMEVKRLGEVLMAFGKFRTAPSKYIGCSPLEADSDHDGMDDYYELFHGMNPLLGASGVRVADGGPCDLVYDAWQTDGSPCFEANGTGDTQNWWQKNPDKRGVALRGGVYDMQAFPWLNGEQNADPDGDDLRNEEEALMARLTSKFWHHTDPTPLWMTDSSYSNSLVRQYFRLPTGGSDEAIVLPKDFFMHGEDKYYFRDFDGFVDTRAMMNRFQMEKFNPDQWKVFGAGKQNWLFSFEENEGYDADHDGLSDREELEGTFRAASDPLDADSPRRRQAMYFQGPERPSALQSMPFVAEAHPVGHTMYGTELSFMQFTVECWVKPDTADDATIIERAVSVPPSNPGDQELIRRNFELSVRDGKWCATFDPNGTLENEVAAIDQGEVKPGKWTHLAATYDGVYLTLYVNGKVARVAKSGLQPTTAVGNIALNDNQSFWFTRSNARYAFLIGAAFKTNADGVDDGEALDVTLAKGWDRYRGFYRGYVDEVRVWDGARTAEEVRAEMLTRFDAKMAAENRKAFYLEWAEGKRRNTVDVTGAEVSPVAELRFHWSFDSVFGAENERALNVCPHAFDAGGVKAPLSRPADYGIAWHQAILNGYEGSVYSHPAWVSWIPNTVAHLPRFDGTTLDSAYWAEDSAGGVAGTYLFPNTAEPVSRWTQMVRNGVTTDFDYSSTGARHLLANSVKKEEDASLRYEFAGRNRNLTGDDLIPLGGAYAKYVSATEGGLWDDEGASSSWEITGGDSDGDGLPDWWEIYAEQNYRDGMDPDEEIGWKTLVRRNGSLITAGEAYLLDLANGAYVDGNGQVHVSSDEYLQTADCDHDGMPDVWEELAGIHVGTPDYSVGHTTGDPDGDGLSNYAEYLISEVFGYHYCSPIMYATNDGVCDYFLKVGDLYLGEIFTDHDQIDDAWEETYQGYADRCQYDPDRDDDNDGWSNYEEFRAGTDPTVDVKAGVDGYTKNEYPVPVIEAKVAYAGPGVNFGSIVFQAWNESEPMPSEMTSAPDAIWTIGGETVQKAASTDNRPTAGSKETGSEPVSYEKYVGRKPSGWQRYVLGGGMVTEGSVKLCFLDKGYVTCTVDEDDNVSDIRPGDPDKAKWYYEVYDRSGKLVLIGNALYGDDSSEIGTIDYETGLIEIDFSKLTGERISLASSAVGGVSTNASSTTSSGVTVNVDGSAVGGKSYELVNLDNAYVLINWTAQNAGLSASGVYYLSDADQATPEKKSRGHVRSGKNTFFCFSDENGDGVYTPGEPFGVVRGVDVGWQGAKFTVQLTETHAVSPRISLWEDKSDRDAYIDEPTYGEIDSRNVRPASTNSDVTVSGENVVRPESMGESVRVRVARYAVDGFYTYSCGARNRVVMDKIFTKGTREILCEADFLGEGEFDLDWATLKDEVSDPLVANNYPVTNVSYLVVIGNGPTGFDRYYATNEADRVTALGTLITRRFEQVRSAPKAIGLKDGAILRSARPTFVWSMPNESAYAKRFGTSYTAFRIQVVDKDTNKLVWTSDVTRAPAQDGEGRFIWTAPLYAGDQATGLAPTFKKAGNYQWRVAMYNAKFKPAASISGDTWSNVAEFSVAVDTEDETDDGNCGSVDVSVKYAGPALVLKDCADVSSPEGKVRIQAFTSADFSGEPVAQGFVTDKKALADLQDETANGRLIGLPYGTYYVRAYIDSNGNFKKDADESWGGAKTPVTVKSNQRAPVAQVYIEDVDTDGDWLPDAWELAKYGDLDTKNAYVTPTTGPIRKLLPGGVAALASVLPNPQARFASVNGVSLMTGVDPANVAPTEGGFEVKSEVDPETLTILGLTVDAANNRVILKVGAETTANVNAGVASLFNVTVKKGAQVTVKVESAASPAGPWTTLKGVSGTVTVDEAGADVKVDLDGELPAQGFFRAKIEE